MKYLFLLVLFISSASIAQKKAETGKQRPNIVVIISDDHAYQAISAYGSQFAKTPAIDRIAKEGVLFNKAFVTNSICGPSRATIITGKYSHKNGFKDNEHSSFDGDQNTFIKELTQAGYQTAWIGKWHLETKPQGFTHWQILPGQGSYFNPDFDLMDGRKERIDGYATNIIEDLSESWLSSRDSTKPFCLVIGHKATHRTWMPDTADLGMYDQVNFPLPANFFDDYSGRKAAAVQDMTIAKTMVLGYDLKMFTNDTTADKEGTVSRLNPAQREKFDAYYKPIYKDFIKQNLSGAALAKWKYQRYMKDYLSTAASLDRNIGRTLNYLDENDLTKNTIVIYLSDQGFFMGEHGWFDKRFMYEESFRTPMVMRYPGFVKPGIVNNDLILNLDIAPTLLQAAGVNTPADMQGSSILPLVIEKKAQGREVIYYHYYENGEHSVSPHFGIRTKRYKIIRFYKRVSSWELYDLEKDPSEMINLAESQKYQKIFIQMKKKLVQEINHFDDKEALEILSEGLK